MKLRPDSLLSSQHGAYYLYGEDHDAIFEAADALLNECGESAVRLRLDVGELSRIEQESKNQGLFGPSCCYAMVRNAQSANPKQSEYLLRLIGEVAKGNRIIVCAPGIEWKKALHKKMQAVASLAQCEFSLPDAIGFERWLQSEIAKSKLQVSEDALQWMAVCLNGMRQAARQMIKRLSWYEDGSGRLLGLDVVGDLLGERAPDALEDWCHAVAMRDQKAVSLAARLLREQQVAEVQMLSWLGTRIQQLLLFSWFQAKHERNPAQAARVFGEARKKVAVEARNWKGQELMQATSRIIEAEKLIKGASLEDNAVVMERLTLGLVGEDGLGE